MQDGNYGHGKRAGDDAEAIDVPATDRASWVMIAISADMVYS